MCSICWCLRYTYVGRLLLAKEVLICTTYTFGLEKIPARYVFPSLELSSFLAQSKVDYLCYLKCDRMRRELLQLKRLNWMLLLAEKLCNIGNSKATNLTSSCRILNLVSYL